MLKRFGIDPDVAREAIAKSKEEKKDEGPLSVR